MIRVTLINGTPIVLNCDLIEQLQTVPDTMIALTSGKRLLVQESPEEIVERVVGFRSKALDKGTCCGKTGVGSLISTLAD